MTGGDLRSASILIRYFNNSECEYETEYDRSYFVLDFCESYEGGLFVKYKELNPPTVSLNNADYTSVFMNLLGALVFLQL